MVTTSALIAARRAGAIGDDPDDVQGTGAVPGREGGAHVGEPIGRPDRDQGSGPGPAQR